MLLVFGLSSQELANAMPSKDIFPPTAKSSYPTYPFGIKTVVIDAGHGGKDPGCLGITTSKEKEIALGIALKLGKYIKDKIPDVKVIYTRTTDVFLELDERAAIANKNKADLFICIHCNTACTINKKTRKKTCNEEVVGTETYVMGLHKTNANLNVAKRENESILLEKNYQKRYDGFDPNSETGYILLTMQQSAYLKQSLNFASKIQKHVKEKAGRVDKGVQQAGFLVLWRTAMPSVLIETEFLSSTESEKYITSDKGQENLARSIFSAFREYKDEVEGKLVKYEDDIENEKPLNVKKKDNQKDITDNKEEPSNHIITKTDDKPIIKDTTAPIKDSLPKSIVKDTIAPITNTVVMTIAKDSSVLSANKPTQADTVKSKTAVLEKIVYKIQFLSSGKRVPMLSDKFKGLKDVSEYQDGIFYKYTAGEFKTISEAMEYRKQMQILGHTDCFVVKFKDGVRMKN